MGYDECCSYFSGKLNKWDSTHPHYNMKSYVNNKGKSGLIEEFRNDPLFMKVVCPYLKEYAVGKEKDMAASILKDANSLLRGNPLSAEIDIVVAAVLEVCGYQKEAIGLLEILVGAVIVVGLVGAAVSLFKSK